MSVSSRTVPIRPTITLPSASRYGALTTETVRSDGADVERAPVAARLAAGQHGLVAGAAGRAGVACRTARRRCGRGRRRGRCPSSRAAAVVDEQVAALEVLDEDAVGRALDDRLEQLGAVLAAPPVARQATTAATANSAHSTTPPRWCRTSELDAEGDDQRERTPSSGRRERPGRGLARTSAATSRTSRSTSRRSPVRWRSTAVRTAAAGAAPCRGVAEHEVLGAGADQRASAASSAAGERDDRHVRGRRARARRRRCPAPRGARGRAARSRRRRARGGAARRPTARSATTSSSGSSTAQARAARLGVR